MKSFLLDKELAEKMQVLQDTLTTFATQQPNEHLNRDTMKDILQVSETPINGPLAQLGTDLISDIELLENYKQNDTQPSVFSATNRTFTYGGSEYLKAIFLHPLCGTDFLVQRQHAIKTFADKLDTLKPHLSKMKENEAAVAWIFNSDKEDLTNLYDMVYFTTWFTRPFNLSDKALTAYNIYRILISPTIGILSPICYVLVPFYILRKQVGISLSFFTYVKYMIQMMFASDSMFLPRGLSSFKYISFAFTLIFYFQGVFNSVELASAVNRICGLITDKVNGFINFVKASNEVVSFATTTNNNLIAPFFQPMQTNPNKAASGKIDTFATVDTPKYSVFNNFGKQLSIFKKITLDDYRPLINTAYICDAVASLAILKQDSKCVFTQYVDDDQKGTQEPVDPLQPFLSYQDMWHPCLAVPGMRKSPVCNSIVLGQNLNHSQSCNTNANSATNNANALLTGPNAGGKSTFIKSLLINTLFAQTCGLTFSRNAILRPFHLINSQINVPDCKGKESLFEAEMYRSKANLDALATLDPKQCALIVMDEIFNSTNPVEGIAGAYAIAKHMASYKNASCVITTHYLYLTKLAKELPSSFTNYRMNVNIDKASGSITYPYKLGRGVSKQYIALELLRINGFDAALIDDAITVKNRLTSVSVAETTNNVESIKNIDASNTETVLETSNTETKEEATASTQSILPSTQNDSV